METLYEYIERVAREEKVLTIRELAEQADLTHNTIYNTRYRRPTLKTYRKLAKVLGIDPKELYRYPIGDEA